MKIEDEDYEEIIKIINETKKAQTFVLEGSLFKGNNVSVIKRYVKEKSDKKFRTWLIDEGLLIDDLFDKNYILPKRENLNY